MSFLRPKGTYDIYGKEVVAWRTVEQAIRKLCDDFCIEEIRTPMFEYTDLFCRGVGETSDIVQKEMFSFTDQKGRSFTLKPEGTAAAARAFVENSMYAGKMPVKLFYITPAFRAENPQKGRQRQFHQFGVEMFGAYGASADAEVISMVHELLSRLGVKGVSLQINSLGCNNCREAYNETLKQYLQQNSQKLCATCQDRLEKNPLRILDCKATPCQEVVSLAPSVLESLDEECTNHFSDLQADLTTMGIPFTINHRMVRGLDYYTKTVFEFVSDNLGAQSTVCGGGRYDNLVEACGGQKTGATGFAMGIERLLIIMEEQNLLNDSKPIPAIFVGSMGDAGNKKAQQLVFDLRKQNICAEYDALLRSVKAQFKFANAISARFAIIVGETELLTGKGNIKNMETGEQTEVKLNELATFLKSNTITPEEAFK